MVICLAILVAGVLTGTTTGLPLLAQEQTPLDAVPASVQSTRRIRIVWGGGDAQSWAGSIRLPNGTLRLCHVLGMETDSSASLSIAGDRLEIRPVKPATYRGVELEIRCDASAQLEIALNRRESPGQPVVQTISLETILDASDVAVGQQVPLDETGNVLDVRLAPSDLLPVSLQHDHLVFAPGDNLALTVNPFRSPGDRPSLKLDYQVTRCRDASKITSGQTVLTADDSGWTMPADLQLATPDSEGAYNLVLQVHDDSLATRLGLASSLITRTIQFVVVADSPAEGPEPDEVALWTEVQSIGDRLNPWLPKMPGLPQFRQVSAPRSAGTQIVEYEGNSYTEIAGGGWQAIPLQIRDTGQPHLIEVEYIDDGPVRLGLSVMQPDASGTIPFFGADSGILIPNTAVPGQAVIRRHQFPFWPTHDSPWLVFANRDPDRPVRIGNVRVLAGPDHLAAADTNLEQRVLATGSQPPSRQFLAFQEAPLILEAFGAKRLIDPETGQALDDWSAWLDGANRWAEHLKASGHTGAMLVVSGDGSALYPSSLLQPGPRYDNGILASSPVDPIRKDVVELLLRVFRREGLTLVPLAHLNSPIPVVEQALRGSVAQSDLEIQSPILLSNIAGQTRRELYRSEKEAISYYNPLHPVVQQAAGDIVRELAQRYGRHDSFGGTGLLMSQYALPVIPGQGWCADAETAGRFAAESGIDLSTTSDSRARLNQVLSGADRLAWLDWRQKKMESWFHDLAESCGANADRQPLYLVGTDLFECQDAFSVLAPSLRRAPDLAAAAARIGLPLQRLLADDDLVWLQPVPSSPDNSLAESRLQIQLASLLDAGPFATSGNDGFLFYRSYSWAHFEQYQKSRPFGQPEAQPIMRMQPLIPGEHWSREPLANSLTSSDITVLASGGRTMGLGQESGSSQWASTFSRIPAVPFTTLPVEGPSALVVRQTELDGRNWFYLANPAPWPIKATLILDNPNTILSDIANEAWTFTETSDGRLQLNVVLEPFALKAGHTEPPSTIVAASSETEARVAASLQEKMDWLISRVSQAQTADAIAVLQNPDFQRAADPSGLIDGWFSDAAHTGFLALIDDSTRDGNRALSMRSEGGAVWIRSNEFPAPVTGRLSIAVRLRLPPDQPQPPLRISVQGFADGQVYYRFGSVGAGEGDTQRITDQWREFAVHFDDLPLGEATPLRIGFDLMGPGMLEIDDVRVYDRWLDKQDGNAITQQLQVAGFQLTSKGNADKCRRILEGYWPRFLTEFFPPADSGSQTADRFNIVSPQSTRRR